MEKNVIEFPKKSEPEIKGYFHCAKCTEEVPSDMSISEYSDYDVGFTSYGIEVWCNRHNERVFYFDLTDIWETLNLLKNIRGEEPMPIFKVKEENFPSNLIYSGVEGVYINPNEYWKGEEIPNVEHLHIKGSFYEDREEIS
jgi:hypothetical protein